MSLQWNGIELLDGLDRDGAARLIIGAPGAGKTGFALHVLMEGLKRYGGTNAVMTVSGRLLADDLGNRIIRQMGVSAQARPVTTLGAVAFRVIAATRAASSLPAPRLLNGAEQDVLLRRVMASHVGHAVVGDDCETCDLLRAYFAQSDWARLVQDAIQAPNGDTASANPDSNVAQSGGADQAVAGSAGGSSSADVFARGISSAFIGQLRDMLARLDELGAGPETEPQLLAAVVGDERLSVQWRLAFALRREYIAAQSTAYPGQYRLDASYLLVAGARAVHEAYEAVGPAAATNAWLAEVNLPQLLVVDDVQDTTLAGMRFLEELNGCGVKVVLVGNPDESVQSFRGSYPEYLMHRAVHGALHAVEQSLRDHRGGDHGTATGAGNPSSAAQEPAAVVSANDPALPDGSDAADVPALASVQATVRAAQIVASRVSLSILSPVEESLPVAKRPGKLTAALAGNAALSKNAAMFGNIALDSSDDSLTAALYRSPREELDDVVWRIKRAHLDHRLHWNDMAVIAHDNATVRLYGERLRRDGVPVRYSSVTRPLKDESFVQGLFALIELARLRQKGVSGCRMSLASTASYVRSRVSVLMNSPLITTGSNPGQGRPARLAPIESAMSALESLAPLASGDTVLAELAQSWGVMRETYRETHCDALSGMLDTGAVVSGRKADFDVIHADIATSGSENVVNSSSSGAATVSIDDSLISPQAADDLSFGSDALYVMLAFDDSSASAEQALAAIGAVLGNDPQNKAFANLWHLVGKTCAGISKLPKDSRTQPRYVLAAAWNAAGIAYSWQRAALANTPEGRAANDRLDAAMRLFQFVESATSSRDIMGFIAQVRDMEIQADSLAHIGPVEDAVTLTTPAGAAGRYWQRVWMPALQQDVWPNLANRNTLFGGEDLAELLLNGSIEHEDRSGHDPRLAAVLASEKKSFLVALTRAYGNVTISAVWNDDLSPSDFLFGYLPEWYRRDRESSRFTAVGSTTGMELPQDGMQPLDLAGMDADPRGLVTAARVMLATSDPKSAASEDAAAALALLAQNGVPSANPDSWAFSNQPYDCEHRIESTQPVAPAMQAENKTESGSSHMPANGKQTTKNEAAASAVGTNAVPAHAAPSVVVLSPSAVDNLWACPVCWLLENRFAGPRPSSVDASFGTLIHAVAQQGSEEGLDQLNQHPDMLGKLGLDEAAAASQRISAVAERLNAIYQSKRQDPAAIADTKDRYRAISRDESAADMLANIATYFVTSGSDPQTYLGRNATKFQIGQLVQADCEREFAARFGLDDICAAYNALPDMQPVDRATLAALMGSLVGGWPEGMSDDITIRLSGRIDRMERRVLDDGSENIRLIDYKTGKTPTIKHIFNDLQLVCYQLGLAFPEDGPRGEAALHAMPYIGQSALFHVGQHEAPATSRAPEGVFQPPLFTHGSLNDEPFTVRLFYKDPGNLFDIPVPDVETPPENVPAEVWQQFAALAGTQALWALTMISRVFYAAAASRSAVITAHPQASHVAFCRMKDVCPACAGQIHTIYETRQA